jgi:hypothetical protein
MHSTYAHLFPPMPGLLSNPPVPYYSGDPPLKLLPSITNFVTSTMTRPHGELRPQCSCHIGQCVRRESHHRCRPWRGDHPGRAHEPCIGIGPRGPFPAMGQKPVCYCCLVFLLPNSFIQLNLQKIV